MLTDLENDITFNKELFQRIKYVYDKQLKSLKGEDKKLTEETYKSFIRSGALLSDDKMARMKEINLRIAELQQQWGDLLPSATNNSVVWVNSEEELAERINELLSDEQKRGTMLVKGLSYAQQFSDKTIAENLIRIYKSIIP